MKIVACYTPEADKPEKESDFLRDIKEILKKISFIFFINLPNLSIPLPVGCTVMFTDATIDLPNTENKDGDIWFQVESIEYNAGHPDTVFLNLKFDDAFDISLNEVISFFRNKWRTEP